MERDRAKLLQQTFTELNSAFSGQNRRAHSAQPPLAVNRVKVTFRDEPGEGSGVARSFYTSVAEVSFIIFNMFLWSVFRYTIFKWSYKSHNHKS